MGLPPNIRQAACFALLIGLGTVMVVPAHSQKKLDAREIDAQGGRDPAAVALRDRIVKTYHDLHAVREKITQRQWKSDPADALTLEIELRFRKPNRLYLAIDYPFVDKPGRWQLIYACDGKTLTVYNSAHNEFQTAKSPARLDRLVLPQALRGPEFIALLRDVSPFDDLEKAAVVKYSEAYEDTVQGSWHTLKVDVQQDGAKRALRYQVGTKDNLVHGFTLAIVPDADTGNPFTDPEIRSSLDARYTLVDPNPRFTDADFHFSPPSGAKEQKIEHAIPVRGRSKDGSVETGTRR